MTKKHVESLLNEGFHILKEGIPTKVDGDLWEYLSGLNDEVLGILVLEELLNWEDIQLSKIKILV